MASTLNDDAYAASNPENLLFWQAAEEGKLLGKACSDCGKLHWYPRVICPFCRSANTHWVSLSGRGKVYAYSTLRRASPPYTVAYVQLDEGPTMLTNLVDMPEADMHIGVSVRVVFRRTEDGRTAPKFTSAQ
jgi:uncharacterized protein